MARKVLLYSLPHDCPIPWPAHPTYAIVDPSEQPPELDQAYLDALYSDVHKNIISKSRQFGHHLLALASELSRDQIELKVRSIILPLHDFDRKWRNTIPSLVRPTSTENVDPAITGARPTPPTGKKSKLDDKEVTFLLGAHREWRQAEEAKLDKDRPKSLPVIQEDVEHPQETKQIYDDASSKDGKLGSLRPEGVEDEVVHKPVAWTKKEVNDTQWVAAGELFDTLLHGLLLLTLITLPAPLESPEVKPKKKKDPERHAATLDPELLLDFLTDRLQIWRVMRDVDALGLGGSDSQASDPKKKEGVEVEDRDEVQQWWLDVVEALFGPHASPELLSHHRAKLFPSATPADALAIRLAPAPSPFKTRSLLSLDKSARRKERDQWPLVVESPTMKRLLGLSSVNHDSFKVPILPFRSKPGDKAAASPASKSTSSKADHTSHEKTSDAAAPRSKPPRKQPRPLPRGDSLISSSKGLFNRREVSFGKPKPGSGIKNKAVSASKVAEQTTVDQSGANHVNKRKSMSPKKSSSTANMTSFTLVPDTPAASRTSSATMSTQVPVVPSFAALGAAFRPGASSTPDFLPASLSAAAPMDWDDDEEDELYLRGFERDNGKLSHGKRQVDSIMGTPQQSSRISWVIPDT